MGVLRVDHPDIMDFIGAKQQEGALANFNLSVAVSDSFMEATRDGKSYSLVNPRTGERAGEMDAGTVMEAIASSAWRCGDPGMIFIDRINRDNPTPRLGPMEATNPCGEQPLLPYESCNLGSIDVSKMVSGGDFDWDGLEELVTLGVRLLDDVIDANRYPMEAIKRITLGNRKIGLGVMGLAEALIKLGIPYDSDEALDKADALMRFIMEHATAASAELGKKRGSFPNFPGSTWESRGYKAMRNATLTTIAPTGSISVIAGTTSGIEPLFAISFVRDVMDGMHLLETNQEFVQAAVDGGFFSDDLMGRIARSGSVRTMEEVPADVRKLFVTAMDIDPERHIRMQAACQKHVDNAVSKTVNLPRDAGIDRVRQAFMLAWELECKGVTVFRYGSRRQQVLYLSADEPDGSDSHVRAASEFAGGCPAVDCEI
jgi:ribonucleoside-diphosphate reductase alpha chain